MKVCLSQALLIVASASMLAHLPATEAKSAQKSDAVRVPIQMTNGPIRTSTMGRWKQTLRKYGISAHRPTRKNSRHGHNHHNNNNNNNNNSEDKDSILELDRSIARIPLIDFDFDREYYGTVMVGEPAQAFKIDFDTGSSQFIISSKTCPQCSGTSHYDREFSTTFQSNGNQPWHITYGDMTHAEGSLGSDNVFVNGMKIHGQQLALVESESQGFDDTIDGIMGLAFGSLSTTVSHTKTVFENMMGQDLLEQTIFSFYLGKTSKSGGGEVIFGGMDKNRIEDGHELIYTPVTRAKYWQMDLEGVYVNGQRIDYQAGQKFSGIMDTGTTLLVAPNKLTRLIHQKIKGAKLVHGESWTVPCDLAKRESHGKIELEIEGSRFMIPYEDLVREESDYPGVCFSGIQTSSASFMIVGDLFIKNNYVVFDYGQKRIGIAPLKGSLKGYETIDDKLESKKKGGHGHHDGGKDKRKQKQKTQQDKKEAEEEELEESEEYEEENVVSV